MHSVKSTKNSKNGATKQIGPGGNRRKQSDRNFKQPYKSKETGFALVRYKLSIIITSSRQTFGLRKTLRSNQNYEC
jgi:hypothetical protein